MVLTLATANVFFASLQGLYRARACAIRSLEATRIVKATLMTGLATLLVPRLFGAELPLRRVVLGVVVSLVLDLTGRALYARWLRASRTKGRFSRAVILVGDNEEASDLLRLTREHPEDGLRVIGLVGRPGATGSTEIDLPWLGTFDDLSGCALAAAGAIVAASALTPADLNRVVRRPCSQMSTSTSRAGWRG